ncbi:MAG: pyruvate, phosphate dikinase, partial [Alphaproteobacteria bacterium]|nr:pyruvate, phosphate dikinase [Alphaproteobacteria bacterium]
MTKKYVYLFADGKAEGTTKMKDLLGGKGANLAEMTNAGLPVPPGFTITTEACNSYYDAGEQFPEGLIDQVLEALAKVEAATGKKLGGAENPLLVSVRSGAKFSMPGMMDTVLNLGLNDATRSALGQISGNDRFAWDAHRRFIQLFGKIVLGIDSEKFEHVFEGYKHGLGITEDTQVDAETLAKVVADYKTLVKKETGSDFPTDPVEQLKYAIKAVFASWNGRRAKDYRRINKIADNLGTAVNVQTMVFGNLGEDSGTGVAFTRDVSTGERVLYGEYLQNAQGEDVVAGIRTPQYLTRRAREAAGAKAASMEEAMPAVFAELARVFDLLERHYRDMQDIEFTVQQGKLWMLQTRSAKRTAKAALKTAVDMAGEGLITPQQAVLRVDAAALDQLLHPTLDPNAPRDVLTKGLPASPGAASGVAVFDSETAERRAGLGDDVILVRTETSPEDIHGMVAAKGILTARGGMTSHAAVVARGMGRPCVSGAGALAVDLKSRTARVGGRVIAEGDVLTIDGSTGEVMAGSVPTVEPELHGDFGRLMEWADTYRRMKVRTNAETPTDCRTARQFGAEGIGLCRTEHMFFEASRITAVRQMILAEDEAGRRKALAVLLPEQRADFAAIFTIMAGLPVTIRLLDPPLHEFLPHAEAEFADVASAVGLSVDALKRRVAELHEFNPMLGHRGCRLGITYPEIYAMQARAIFEAAVDVARDSGRAVVPEVMVPLVATPRELEITRAAIDAEAKAVFAEKGHTFDYLVGTMIELPRAAIRAKEIAAQADFFSFGTNDLTQTALGISRDDAAKFLTVYVEQGIYPRDPFVSIDVDGVGELVRIAAERGRGARGNLKLGICGEHGGDPDSIRFCHESGL